MRIDAFWALIQGSLDCVGRRAVRESYLRERLIMLPPEEIAEFQSHLINARQRADSWDLWGAAARINGGMCSDDGFEDFRNWLVGCGRDTFERVITTPDSLAELPEIQRLAARPGEEHGDEEGTDWESLSYVAEQAYEEVTGQEDDGSFDEAVDEFDGVDLPDYSAEERWSWTDEQASAARLPNLTRMFPLAG
jgi:hypothetical protein